MTSKLKCPFCGKELVPTSMGDDDTVLYDSVWLPIKNCICNTAASKKIWQALIQSQKDLEESQQATLQNAQTVLEIHKDLEIAVDALNAIIATPLNSRVIHDAANKALEIIGKHNE